MVSALWKVYSHPSSLSLPLVSSRSIDFIGVALPFYLFISSFIPVILAYLQLHKVKHFYKISLIMPMLACFDMNFAWDLSSCMYGNKNFWKSLVASIQKFHLCLLHFLAYSSWCWHFTEHGFSFTWWDSLWRPFRVQARKILGGWCSAEEAIYHSI